MRFPGLLIENGITSFTIERAPVWFAFGRLLRFAHIPSKKIRQVAPGDAIPRAPLSRHAPFRDRGREAGPHGSPRLPV